MARIALTIIAGLTLAPLAASAQVRDAHSILRGQIQALQVAGFSGVTEVQVPPAPAMAMSLSASAQVGETREALASLSRAAQMNVSLIGETVRTLGFDFNGEQLPARGLSTPKNQDIVRFFDVSSFRGTTDIVISEVRRVDGRKEMRSYLISPDGALEAAAMTRKVDGKFLAEKIQISAAQEGCRELLEFWTQYYRDNLKHA